MYASALIDRKMATRTGFEFAQHVQAQRRDGKHARQRIEQPGQTYRLQQIVYRMDFKRLERIVVVRGGKNDAWRILKLLQMFGHFDTVNLRHADIKQNDVDRAFRQHVNGLLAVFRLAGNFNRHLERTVRQQIADAVARRRLIIDDQHPQRLRGRHDLLLTYGITICTSYVWSVM